MSSTKRSGLSKGRIYALQKHLEAHTLMLKEELDLLFDNPSLSLAITTTSSLSRTRSASWLSTGRLTRSRHLRRVNMWPNDPLELSVTVALACIVAITRWIILSYKEARK